MTDESVVNLSVSKIEFLKFELNLSDYDVLVATSKNAFNALKFNGISPINLPVFAIANSCASAAREFGFGEIYTGKNAHGDDFAREILPLLIGARLASLLNERKALKTGLFGTLFASIFIAFMLCFKFEVIGVIIAFFLLLLFTGFVLPTASSLAMNEGREYAGSASAILGFCPFFLGGVVSPLVGLGDIFYSTSIVILACTLLALISFLRLKRVA